MTRFPVVIFKMYNYNKSTNTFSWHPKIKTHSARVTWIMKHVKEIQNSFWVFFCHTRELTLAFPRIMYTTTMNISQNHANNNKLWNSQKLKIDNLQSSWKLWNCKVCRNYFISKIRKHKILTHASSHVFHVKILQWNNKVGSKFVARVRSHI